MIYQLRTYTVNRGMMDKWVSHFNEKLDPLMESKGIHVENAWANLDNNQFIWVRSFADAADLEAKEAAFYGSDEWKDMVDFTRGHLARTLVETMNPVLKVSASA